MILFWILLVATVIASVAVGVSEEDFLSGFGTFLVCALLMGISVFVIGCVSSDIPNDQKYFEVEESETIVEFNGAYITKTVTDKDEYWYMRVGTNEGMHELRISCSRCYLAYDDENPRVEKSHCVAFKKTRLYLFGLPALVDDYYTIYIPKEGVG